MRLAVSLCLIVLVGLPAQAGVEDCREAISKFQSARSEVASALRRYANCVSSSDGHDDCSSEFSALRFAHNDFEQAVWTYESECS